MIKSLTTLLKNGANPALRYLRNSNLPEDLAHMVTQYFKDQAELFEHLPKITTLIKDYDYRLVAEYLAARQNRDEAILSVFYQILAADNPHQVGKQRYQLAYTHFVDTVGFPEEAKVSFTPRLDDVFSPRGNQLIIYQEDHQFEPPLLMLIKDVGAMFSKYIEQQYDVPGLNAVVRQGLVRTWHLPDGTPVISKRKNPLKKGRFRREQYNLNMLGERWGRLPIIVNNPKSTNNPVNVHIARPFAIIYDGYSDQHYALSEYVEGIPLEDILFIKRDSNARNRFLEHYRLVLDTLYEHGILWGDMSPRNILIKEQEQTISYTLVDFEKTQILNAPISIEQRIQHCRGQICVEELGVICPLDEVLECFKGYFDPSVWDLESRVILPFRPRPEIVDILRGRGHDVNNLTLGTYNSIDKAILGVRMPDFDPQTKERRFPGHLGFKVEHYLSCAENSEAGDYDRKTTEVLITAKQQKCFDEVVAQLAGLTDAVEQGYLRTEFADLLQGGFSGNVIPPRQEINNLTKILDMLYETRDNVSAFQSLVS